MAAKWLGVYLMKKVLRLNKLSFKKYADRLGVYLMKKVLRLPPHKPRHVRGETAWCLPDEEGIKTLLHPLFRVLVGAWCLPDEEGIKTLF